MCSKALLSQPPNHHHRDAHPTKHATIGLVVVFRMQTGYGEGAQGRESEATDSDGRVEPKKDAFKFGECGYGVFPNPRFYCPL